jgi:hypothetical protein
MMSSSRTTWFERLFGAPEVVTGDFRGYRATQALFKLDERAGLLQSVVNGATFVCGHFTTPTLGELRQSALKLIGTDVGRVEVIHTAVMDILEEHARHPGALFQAASQLNCLEMPSRSVTPEAGITAYEHDRTQGPACSLACAAGTVVRNYFVDVSALASPHRFLPQGPLGQTSERQINTLDCIEDMVDNASKAFWTVRNGYFCATSTSKLRELAPLLEAQRDILMDCLKVGLQSGVGVTFARGPFVYEPPAAPVSVSQVYCSAVPMPFEVEAAAALVPVARFLLDGTYEATLWAAVQNAARTGCKDVFLTKVGGGVWGNDPDWIAAAIGRAVARVSAAGASLRVHVCHFRAVDPDFVAAVDREASPKLPVVQPA